jgi:hypothetical protein
MTDEELFDIYNLGWNDEMNDKEDIKFYISDHPLKSKAYHMGRLHFFLGDDQPKYDYLTKTEVIEMIREN